MVKVAAEFWNGKRPLSQAFWLVWVVGGVFVGIVVWIPLIVGLNWAPNVLIALVIGASLIIIAYQVFCLVSVWRCAVNVNARFWAVIARVLVVLSAIQLVIGIIQTKGMIHAPIIELFHEKIG